MKKFYIILMLLGITVLNIQNTFGQTETKAEEKVYSTTMNEMPQKVKEALRNYSGYTISDKATFTKKSKSEVYKVKIKKGIWEYYLLIHESGKIMGIETGENSGE